MEETQKPKGLNKSFGLKMAVIMVMSAIIGSGVFKKVAPMSELLHAPWLVILAWLLAGVVILFGILSIAELGALYPHSGGAYSWLEKIYGKGISFLYGWACFTVIQTAAISSIAFVFAGALDTFIPLPRLSAEWEAVTVFGLHLFRNFGAKLASCLLIILLTVVNIKSTKKGGHLSFLFTALISISIIAVIVAAFGSDTGSVGTFKTVSIQYPSGGFDTAALLSSMVLAMRSAFWGYEGWIALGFIGGEIKDAEKNLPRALIIGIFIIIIFYLLINTAYLYVMPIDELLQAVNADENSIAAVLVMDKLLGFGGSYIISAMILISTFGCTNATILVSSRIYYAMAKKGLFFKKAALIHPKSGTPYNALKYQCIWACILVFSGSFDMLTDMLIIIGFLFFGLVVLGVIRLRITQRDLPRNYKTPGYPFVPALFVLFCLILICVSFIESPGKSVVGILLVVSGLPFYFYWRRKNAKIV